MKKTTLFLLVVLGMGLWGGAIVNAQVVTGTDPFTDGRLNPNYAATWAVYCAPTGGLRMFMIDINTSRGILAFEVSPAQIGNGTVRAVTSNQPFLIASGAGLNLFALPSSELLIQTADNRKPNLLFNTMVPASVCGAPAAAPTPVIGPTAVPDPPGIYPPGMVTSTGQIIHIVAPGETLFRIALRYGTTWPALARANNLANPNRIYIGQRLVIPLTFHVVARGETLARIAARYGVSWRSIAAANHLTNPDLIYVGQVLTIPSVA